MTAYGLQKAIYDYLNAKGRPGAPALDPGDLRPRYELSEPELRALVEADVAALYRLGVHPVLLNSYARARVPRDRYRAALVELERASAGESQRG
jgi:hypothetical protein